MFHIDPKHPAQACVIWMHGLGADANDMVGLAEQLQVNELMLRHVFLDAPVRPITINSGMVMRAWYDILAMDFAAREDKEGILTSEKMIIAAVEQQLATGFTSEQIYLAGFSQGGAMALHTALRMTRPLAGVISLSAYLPLAKECEPQLPGTTPLFLAYGTYDPIVWPLWTKETIKWLDQKGFSAISAHEYPMEHSVCANEIVDLSQWLIQHTGGI
ncbi:phospholipase/carboxylesterase [Legionella rubrilucens]|uniref:Phospholipase/carboxylesterase n=1 Tax=Legionella rubrilucens TaxID=458 RepID=A0A0W0XLS7_9GAMM|nr:carboxylesterase [Legionella rubrilucens]KTD45665.1 phospholipase/carboxylesterase [Legionella rubrilucens]